MLSNHFPILKFSYGLGILKNEKRNRLLTNEAADSF